MAIKINPEGGQPGGATQIHSGTKQANTDPVSMPCPVVGVDTEGVLKIKTQGG